MFTGRQPTHLLWGLGPFCLNGGECMLIMILLKTARMILTIQVTQKLQLRVYLVVLVLCLILLTTRELISSNITEGLCEGLTFLLGTTNSFIFLFLGIIFKTRRARLQHPIPDRVEVFLFACGITKLLLCPVALYFAIEKGVFSGNTVEEFPDVWKWLGIQTAARTLEVATCLFLIAASRKKTRRRRMKSLPIDDAEYEHLASPRIETSSLSTLTTSQDESETLSSKRDEDREDSHDSQPSYTPLDDSSNVSPDSDIEGGTFFSNPYKTSSEGEYYDSNDDQPTYFQMADPGRDAAEGSVHRKLGSPQQLTSRPPSEQQRDTYYDSTDDDQPGYFQSGEGNQGNAYFGPGSGLDRDRTPGKRAVGYPDSSEDQQSYFGDATAPYGMSRQENVYIKPGYVADRDGTPSKRAGEYHDPSEDQQSYFKFGDSTPRMGKQANVYFGPSSPQHQGMTSSEQEDDDADYFQLDGNALYGAPYGGEPGEHHERSSYDDSSDEYEPGTFQGMQFGDSMSYGAKTVFVRPGVHESTSVMESSTDEALADFDNYLHSTEDDDLDASDYDVTGYGGAVLKKASFTESEDYDAGHVLGNHGDVNHLMPMKDSFTESEDYDAGHVLGYHGEHLMPNDNEDSFTESDDYDAGHQMIGIHGDVNHMMPIQESFSEDDDYDAGHVIGFHGDVNLGILPKDSFTESEDYDAGHQMIGFHGDVSHMMPIKDSFSEDEDYDADHVINFPGEFLEKDDLDEDEDFEFGYGVDLQRDERTVQAYEYPDEGFDSDEEDYGEGYAVDMMTGELGGYPVVGELGIDGYPVEGEFDVDGYPVEGEFDVDGYPVAGELGVDRYPVAGELGVDGYPLEGELGVDGYPVSGELGADGYPVAPFDGEYGYGEYDDEYGDDYDEDYDDDYDDYEDY